MNAIELLKEARDELGAVQYYIPPADETVEMTPAITADVDACQKLAERIDTYLSAPSESAMEMVRKIREGATFGHDLSERYCKLLDTEAAALIEDYGRRVLEDYRREEQELLAAKDEYIALLEKASGEGAMFAYVHGFRVPQDEVDAGVRCREKITAIAAKHGVEVEG